VRLVVDAQLPLALAQWLVARGHDAVHVFDLDYARASDSVIWEHAHETGAVIITKDEDFALRAPLRPSGPPVIWIRLAMSAIRSFCGDGMRSGLLPLSQI